MRYTVEWDSQKARANIDKHGVSFEQAVTAFGDPLSVTIGDPDHSTTTAALPAAGDVTAVASARRGLHGTGVRLRLITVRFASQRERRDHE